MPIMRIGGSIAFSSLFLSRHPYYYSFTHFQQASQTSQDISMVKRAVSETSDYLSPKEEPSTPPPTTPKKAKKSPSTPSTNGSRGSIKESPGNGMPGSLAKTARGRYMELIFEAGLKAVNKKAVQDETGLSPAQQSEMVRKDKGPLRRALGGFVGSL